MAYLVKGKSVGSYWDIKFGRSEPIPFAYVLETAASENDAIEFVRDLVQRQHCQTALITGVEEIEIYAKGEDPFGIRNDDLWYDHKLVAFDVETTGLSGTDCRIIEIGFSEYNKETRKFEEPLSMFLNDGQEVSEKVTEITGITNEMIADAPPFEKVAKRIADRYITPGTIFVAHNRTFDAAFLMNSFKRAGLDVAIPPIVCSMELAMRTPLQQKNNRLETIAELLGVEGVNSHRAGEDAQLAGNTFMALARRHPYFHKATGRQFLDYFDKTTWHDEDSGF